MRTLVPFVDYVPDPVFEAYYNAGSAALVLVLVLLAIGTFLWCRIRRRRKFIPLLQNEESIPLTTSMATLDDGQRDDEESFRQRKGKERAMEPTKPPIFDVGDDDDDEDNFKSNNSPR